MNGFSGSGDGRLLTFAASRAVAPAEVFVCRADGSDERQLTHLNRAWTETVSLSKPERFRFTRAGFEVDAWVMRPAGFVPGERYPALLNIHGGPHAQYGNTFFDEFQVYVGAGFGVVACNPRGSSGRGTDFVRTPVGRWHEERPPDLEDILAVVDAALERQPRLDPDRARAAPQPVEPAADDDHVERLRRGARRPRRQRR